MQSDDTSRVTRIALLGRLPRLESLLRKSVVSLMCESKVETRGLMWWSTNCEMRSVGWLLDETMGVQDFPRLKSALQ